MKILKFGALWCPGCLVMNKIWSEITSEYGNIEIENYDIDIDEEKATEYNVTDNIPLYIFVSKDGKELKRLIGEQKKKLLLI